MLPVFRLVARFPQPLTASCMKLSAIIGAWRRCYNRVNGGNEELLIV